MQSRRLVERFLLPEWRGSPENGRRARLIVRFGFLGFFFGLAYAIFYFLIGHDWGAAIVVACSICFGIMPWLLRWSRSLGFAGNSLAAVMTAGFTGLCCVEGGLQGHAVAWLASVPLCALLLADWKAARVWVLICFAVGSVMVACEIKEIALPITYDKAWHPLVNSAGYLGLIAFLFVLGLIFENGRRRAFARMQDALDRLASSNAQLVVLNREKTEFLGIAAHDLRNPLTTIMASAQLLEIKAEPEKVPTLSRAIFKAGKQMRDLIVTLLDANAVEEGRFSCKAERCDLRELAGMAIGHFEAQAANKRITVLLELGPDLEALADHGTTLQVLDNLISNAVKYSPFDTTIRVSVFAEDERTMAISVADEGPGVSAADLQKMFGKFTRLTAQPTGGESSTGLGLSIVKKLTEAMGGTIECRSLLGSGATFILRLPAWKGAERRGG